MIKLWCSELLLLLSMVEFQSSSNCFLHVFRDKAEILELIMIHRQFQLLGLADGLSQTVEVPQTGKTVGGAQN